MKKKVAIITLIGRFNYGNRLQNYALQRFLENNFEVDVKTIYSPNYISNKNIQNRIIYKYLSFTRFYNTKIAKQRYFKIKKFDKKIKFDNKIYTINDIETLNIVSSVPFKINFLLRFILI